MYLVKVEWSGYRTQAVIDVLKGGDVELTQQLELYVNREDMSAREVIKIDWSTDELFTVIRLMSTWLGVADLLAVQARGGNGNYEDVVQQQVQVHAALRDIFTYVQTLKDTGLADDLILPERIEL